MTPNPNAGAGSADVSQEMERMQGILWMNALRDIGAITAETKQHLIDLLGDKAPKELVDARKGWWGWTINVDFTPYRDDIVSALASRNAPLYHMVEQYVASKNNWHTVRVAGSNIDIRTLLTDPDSKETKILAYLYDAYDGKSDVDLGQMLKPTALTDPEKQQLKKLVELRTAFSQLHNDVSFHGLEGKKNALVSERAALASTIGGAPGAVATSAPSAPATAVFVTTAANGNDTAKTFERIRAIDAETAAADAKEQDLIDRLRKIDRLGHAIAKPGVLYSSTHFDANVKPEAKKFGASTMPNFAWKSEVIAVGASSHELQEWIADDTGAEDLTKLEARAKRGVAKINSRVAIDHILTKQVEANEPMANDPEVAAITAGLRNSIDAVLKGGSERGDATSDAAPKVDANVVDGSKKAGLASWASGIAGGIGSYFMKRDKNLFGIKVDDGTK